MTRVILITYLLGISHWTHPHVTFPRESPRNRALRGTCFANCDMMVSTISWPKKGQGPYMLQEYFVVWGYQIYMYNIYIYTYITHTYKYIYICTYYNIIYIFMFYWGNLRSTINSDTSLVWNLWHFLLKGKPPCVASGESDSSLAVVLAVAFTRKPGSPWIPKPTWAPSTVIGG